MIKVIKNDVIIATHEDTVNVIGKYGEDIIICNDNEDDTKRYYYFHGCDNLFMKSQASGLESDRQVWMDKRNEYKAMIEAWFLNNEIPE